MQPRAWILLLLSLGAVFNNVQVMAEEDEGEDLLVEDEEEDTYDDTLDVHEIDTSYKILETTDDGKLPVGKPTTILVDFSNKGQDVFNVTSVSAFLHSPFDLNYYIQNFTTKAISNGVSAPSSQVTLEYKITPDDKLEPLEFWLSGFVEYTVEGSDEPFRQHFVNTTVELFDNKGVDWMSLIMTMILMSAFVAAVYFAGGDGVEKVTGKKMKKKFVPANPDAAPEWEVKAYKASDKARKAGGSRRSKK